MRGRRPSRAAGRQRGALTLLLALLLVPALAAARKAKQPEDLLNPLLSADYALWLVGPVSRLATPEEVEAFLALRDDAAARAFVDAFWQRRDPDPDHPGNALREVFEERLVEADRRFTEAGVPGRRSDRGTVFVLYGAPGEERFEVADHPDDPAVLEWTYPAEAPRGLDGKRPDRRYRFIKRGDVTRFYTPNPRPVRPRPNEPG